MSARIPKPSFHHRLREARNGTKNICVSLQFPILNLFTSTHSRLPNSTGATGYIGGDALYAIIQAHPDYEVACLVRNSDKGAQIASQYPNVRLVYGSLDDVELLEGEAQKADIVLSKSSSESTPFPSFPITLSIY